MRYFYFIIILLAGCQASTTTSENLTVHADSSDLIPGMDSVTSALSFDEETSTKFNKMEFEDINSEKILVDRVHYFPTTREPYVRVGFKDGYDWRALDTLKNYADSIIFEDGEITRTRYPFDKALEYLDLELLDGITIFNYSHALQGTSRLKRIEYFEDVLGDQFIAILETSDDLVGDRFYGINGTTDFISELSSQNTINESLKESIKTFVDHKSKYEWKFGSSLVQPYNLTYAFYSFVSDNEIEKSYLIEVAGKDLKIMAETTNDYSIWELLPVKVQLNERPILLLWVGYPETDSEWFTPAVFDGQQFQITNNRIIYLSKYKNRIEKAVKETSSTCDIYVLVSINENLNNLKEPEIDKFLRTFSNKCRSNVEYSEWRNELLFELVYNYPFEIIKLLNDSTYELPMIYWELESPLTDKYMPIDIIKRINALNLTEYKADSVIIALEVAQSKY